MARKNATGVSEIPVCSDSIEQDSILQQGGKGANKPADEQMNVGAPAPASFHSCVRVDHSVAGCQIRPY